MNNPPNQPMTDELDEIIDNLKITLKFAYGVSISEHELQHHKQAIQALIDRECTKARIDELNTIDDGLYDVGASKGEWGIPTKWSKDNYADLWTPNNAIHEYIQGCIAELSNKENK